MKLEIKKQFRDRETKELYKVGAVIEFDEARAEELRAHPAGLVKEVQEQAEKPKKKTARKKKQED